MDVGFDAPLIQTICHRRTKRFPLGGKLLSRRANLAYESKDAPVPLNELELAFLCYAASGVTGVTVEEIRHLMGHLTGIGRTAASPCASLTLELLFTNDDGVFYYETPAFEGPFPEKKVRIDSEQDRHVILADFRSNTRRLQPTRLAIPRSAIGSAFESMVNLPGTTLFVPVVETTREYINMLLTCLIQFRWQLWDEVSDQPAGVGRWIKKGTLTGKRVTIAQYEAMLPCVCNLEVGMAMQNLSLAATAMGLGSFMMHTIDTQTVMSLLNVCYQNQSAGSFPQATPNPTGIDGVVEGYCPPYLGIEDAVEAIVARKWGRDGLYGPKGYDLAKPHLYEDLIECAKAYCSYIYGTYHRFPKYVDALSIPILLQTHHLDLGFYKNKLPEFLTTAERDHMRLWHQ